MCHLFLVFFSFFKYLNKSNQIKPFKVGQSVVDALKYNFIAEPSEKVPDTTNLKCIQKRRSHSVLSLVFLASSSLLDQLDWRWYTLLGAVQILCGGASNHGELLFAVTILLNHMEGDDIPVMLLASSSSSTPPPEGQASH